MASISGCVIPIPVEVCRGGGWGGWVARLSIAVTSSDAMSLARLALRGIVDHICELGLRHLLASLNTKIEGGGRLGDYLKSGDIHGFLRNMTGRER